jgi:hypothetical protein
MLAQVFPIGVFLVSIIVKEIFAFLREEIYWAKIREMFGYRADRAMRIWPYIEQQNLFNASNVLGYPGIPGPYSPGPP